MKIVFMFLLKHQACFNQTTFSYPADEMLCKNDQVNGEEIKTDKKCNPDNRKDVRLIRNDQRYAPPMLFHQRCVFVVKGNGQEQVKS